LEDAVAKNVKDGLFDDSDISYEYLIYKLASKGLTDTSETKLKIAKELGKEKRRRSNDLRLQLLERLYRFGRETGGDDENFKELYLQISQELMKLELQLQDEIKRSKKREKTKLKRRNKTNRWREYHRRQEEGWQKRLMELEISQLKAEVGKLRKTVALLKGDETER
jgi:hypothetical protein